MTLDDLEQPIRRKDASFGAYHKNVNEDRSILGQQKCRPMTLLSGDVRFIRIFVGVGRGRQTTVGLLTTAIFIFQCFRWLLLRKL